MRDILDTYPNWVSQKLIDLIFAFGNNQVTETQFSRDLVNIIKDPDKIVLSNVRWIAAKNKIHATRSNFAELFSPGEWILSQLIHPVLPCVEPEENSYKIYEGIGIVEYSNGDIERYICYYIGEFYDVNGKKLPSYKAIRQRFNDNKYWNDIDW